MIIYHIHFRYKTLGILEGVNVIVKCVKEEKNGREVYVKWG